MNTTIPGIVPETLYTSEEVSEYLRLSLRTVQRLLQTKGLPSYKIHGQYRVKGLDLLTYLDGVRQDEQTLENATSKPADLIPELDVKPVSIGFGKDWLPRVQSEAFMDELQDLRKSMVQELGFIMPGIQLKDQLDLPPTGYEVSLHGVPLSRQEGTELESFKTHMQDILRRYAYDILCRDEVAIILEQVRKSRPTVVEEVLSEMPQTGKLTVGQLTQILRALLEEQVSIRNLGRILEILADNLLQENTIEAWVEKVRQGLSRQLNAPLRNAKGIIEVMALAPEQEAQLKAAFEQENPVAHTQWSQRLLGALTQHSLPNVLICAVELRKKLAGILARKHPNLTVLSYQEVARETQIELVHTLSL